MNNEMHVVKYLIHEMEEENWYKVSHSEAVIEAKRKHKEDWRKHIPKEYKRNPNNTLIKENAKKIRQIMLKISKGATNE
jgi:hypothetical protein